MCCSTNTNREEPSGEKVSKAEKHHQDGVRKEGGDAHGETEGRSTHLCLQSRARQPGAPGGEKNFRSTTTTSSNISTANTTRGSVAETCAQKCLRSPPHPPSARTNTHAHTVTHTLTRSLEATEGTEKVGELQAEAEAPELQVMFLLTRSRRRVGAPRMEAPGTLLVAHARAHLE